MGRASSELVEMCVLCRGQCPPRVGSIRRGGRSAVSEAGLVDGVVRTYEVLADFLPTYSVDERRVQVSKIMDFSLPLCNFISFCFMYFF